MAVRHQSQQQALIEQAKITAAAEMANRLAHQINNPLQSLVNVAYLAAEGHRVSDPQALGRQFCTDLHRLSVLVNESLKDAGESAG
jgi:nitrogen-specific signal transduction histidine kinase